MTVEHAFISRVECRLIHPLLVGLQIITWLLTHTDCLVLLKNALVQNLESLCLPLQLLDAFKAVYVTWGNVPLLLQFDSLLYGLLIVELPVRFKLPLTLSQAFGDRLLRDQARGMSQHRGLFGVVWLFLLQFLSLRWESKCLVAVYFLKSWDIH